MPMWRRQLDWYFPLKPMKLTMCQYLKIRINARALIHEFKDLLESKEILWVGQNAKYDSTIMKWYGVEIKGPYFDTMIAHYLCEPDLRHKLDYLTEAYLDYKMVPIEDLIGKGKTNSACVR